MFNFQGKEKQVPLNWNELRLNFTLNFLENTDSTSSAKIIGKYYTISEGIVQRPPFNITSDLKMWVRVVCIYYTKVHFVTVQIYWVTELCPSRLEWSSPHFYPHSKPACLPACMCTLNAIHTCNLYFAIYAIYDTGKVSHISYHINCHSINYMTSVTVCFILSKACDIVMSVDCNDRQILCLIKGKCSFCITYNYYSIKCWYPSVPQISNWVRFHIP